MNSSVRLDNNPQISCHSPENINTIRPSIARLVARYGYCTVNLWDTSITSLLLLRNQLGKGQLHVRANSLGLVSVAHNPLEDTKDIDPSKYFSIKTCEHTAHTDGAYLNGFLISEGQAQRIGPPSMVLLQCVQPAEKGGESIIVDAQKILEDLLKYNPEVAEILATPGCASFCRDDQIAFNSAIYEAIPDNRYRIRFRCDNALYVASSRVHEAVQYFCNYYLDNPKYKTTMTLEPRQVLILDNLRVLHGRKKFSGSKLGFKRFLRRTWIVDSTLPTAPKSFIATNQNDCRVFKRFEPYAAIQHDFNPSSPHLKLGIRLPGNLQAVLQSSSLYPFPCSDLKVRK
ncbi:MAG: TauD/TfdA family dioxygenase [Cyanobacteria bacterium J06560_6]